MMHYWLLPVTVIVFLLVRKIALRIAHPLFNPLIISVLILLPIVYLTRTSSAEYAQQVKVINDLLPYSVVALAYPLYELLPQIKRHWRMILSVTFCGSLCAMLSGVMIAVLCGASPAIMASILPKSVTTPIAVVIAKNSQGIVSIAAICVILVGTFGAIFGHLLLDCFKIKSAAARGLAIGTISHAVGTARCIENSYEEGAYSSLSLVLCGIITSLVAPLLLSILLYIQPYL